MNSEQHETNALRYCTRDCRTAKTLSSSVDTHVDSTSRYENLINDPCGPPAFHQPLTKYDKEIRRKSGPSLNPDRCAFNFELQPFTPPVKSLNQMSPLRQPLMVRRAVLAVSTLSQLH